MGPSGPNKRAPKKKPPEGGFFHQAIRRWPCDQLLGSSSGSRSGFRSGRSSRRSSSSCVRSGSSSVSSWSSGWSSSVSGWSSNWSCFFFRASSQGNGQQGGDQQGFFHLFSLINSQIKQCCDE